MALAQPKPGRPTCLAALACRCAAGGVPSGGVHRSRGVECGRRYNWHALAACAYPRTRPACESGDAAACTCRCLGTQVPCGPAHVPAPRCPGCDPPDGTVRPARRSAIQKHSPGFTVFSEQCFLMHSGLAPSIKRGWHRQPSGAVTYRKFASVLQRSAGARAAGAGQQAGDSRDEQPIEASHAQGWRCGLGDDELWGWRLDGEAAGVAWTLPPLGRWLDWSQQPLPPHSKHAVFL